jgi:hypothetical protein
VKGLVEPHAAAGTAVPAACSGNMLDSSDSFRRGYGLRQLPLGERPLSLPISNMFSILDSQC